MQRPTSSVSAVVSAELDHTVLVALLARHKVDVSNPVHTSSDGVSVSGLVRGCHVRQTYSRSPTAYAAYRDLINSSAVAAVRSPACNGPQHRSNISPLPHGQSSVADTDHSLADFFMLTRHDSLQLR